MVSTCIFQTDNLSRRLPQNNSGYVAQGTADPIYCPYALAAYICGLNGMYIFAREALEGKWKRYFNSLQSNGKLNVYACIKKW